jgi:hypothetical protein
MQPLRLIRNLDQVMLLSRVAEELGMVKYIQRNLDWLRNTLKEITPSPLPGGHSDC